MRRLVEDFKYRLANNYVYIAERLIAADRIECDNLRCVAIHFIAKAVKIYPAESNKYKSIDYMIPFVNRYTKSFNRIIKAIHLKES